MRVHPLARVVALDIDGTLGDYHGHFEWFLRMIYLPHGAYLNNSTSELRAWWRDTIQGEFSDALGLPKDVYRNAKMAFRQGGMKRCMPAFRGINEVAVQSIREQGIQVWITTSRPWMRLDNIDPDTQYWLKHNIGQVDGVIYGEDKYADLIDIVGHQRILGIVDDLPENVVRAQQLGLRAAMRRAPHNEWWSVNPVPENVRVFTKSEDMFKIIREWDQIHVG